MRTLRSRLTYANVMSTLAVFLVLGGTAVAAGALNGRTIVRHSISGAKLKNNTLGHRQVKESSLTTVRRAKNAANATRLAGIPAPGFLRATGKAADADRLDGLDSTAFALGQGVSVVRKGVSLAPGDAATFTPVATVAALGTVDAACSDDGGQVTVRYVSATLARQFVTDQHADAGSTITTDGATLPAGGTHEVGADDVAGTADFALSGRLTTVRDAPDGDSAEIDFSAVMRPAGEARCIVSVTALAG